MSITRNSLRRPAAFFAAAALLIGAAAPALLGVSPVSAAQLTSRSIQMSDSAPSGTAFTGVGSGDAVKYTAQFTTSASMQSFVIDYCGGTPLIEDTCSAVSGLVITGATLTANGTWSLASTTGHTMKFTNTGPQGAGTFTFELNNITNPDTAGTFYARITTYADAAYGAGDPYVSDANVGTYVDYGGVAMSVNETITVTARVMEQISLCADGGAVGTNASNITAAGSCGSATTPAITLGSAPDYVLGYTGATPASANVYTQLSTNASGGYALYLRASNTSCSSDSGGLSRDGGATCEIAPINNGGAATTFTDNVAEFGAFVSDGTAATGGSGANTAVARWDGTGSTYIMDTTTASDNVLSTYGSKIAETTGAPYQADSVNNTITFAAVASPTTPAGIYSENFTLIGVGTF